MLTLLLVGHNIGVLDGPSLGRHTSHFSHTDVDVVGLEVSSLWLSNLSVDPKEGSVVFDISAGSSSILRLTE